jgi:hypothetical protein
MKMILKKILNRIQNPITALAILTNISEMLLLLKVIDLEMMSNITKVGLLVVNVLVLVGIMKNSKK